MSGWWQADFDFMAFCNVMLGHSLQGMAKHHISLTDEDVPQAMAVYTARLDDEIAEVDQSVDPAIYP